LAVPCAGGGGHAEQGACRGFVDERGPGHQALEELSPEEQDVALLAAAGRNWSAAAEEAGLSKADGQRIHRKAKRLARKFTARQLERDRTLADGGITLR
jgi:hypothetical protein